MLIPTNANADRKKPGPEFRQKEMSPLLIARPYAASLIADYSELMHMEIPTEVPTHQSIKTSTDHAMPFIIPANHWVNEVYGSPPYWTGLRSVTGTV